MQIYTEIFIGMAVGVLAGTFLGPNSIVAPKNAIHADNGAALELFHQADRSAKRLRLPRGMPVSLNFVQERAGRDGKIWHLLFEPNARHVLG